MFSAGCSTGFAGDTPIAYAPISTDVTIQPRQSGDRRVVDIYSESGIGEAAFWIMDSSRVVDVTLRLHLHGLEQLTIALPNKELRISVTSHGDRVIRQSIVGDDGTETPIAPDSRYWSTVTPGETKHGLPQHFDVKLPAAASDANGAFRMAWVDYFR